MEVRAVKSPVIKKGDSVFDVFCGLDFELKEKDILCAASKVVAYEQGRIKSLEKTSLEEVVREEADEILEEGQWALTMKDGVVTCNAGIDNSNVEKGFVVLWPQDVWEWAENFRKLLKKKFDLEELGVVVTDSRCTPRRLGVTGFALAWAGFVGIRDERGKKDLFGNDMSVTQRNLADSIADGATLLMGEADESTPFAVVREAPVEFSDDSVDPKVVEISREEDLFHL